MTTRNGRTTRRNRAWNVAPVIAFAAALLHAGCSRTPEAPKIEAKDPAVAPIGGSGGRFVGSTACRECHTREYESWTASRHRSTLRAWAEGTPLRLADKPLAAPYGIGRDGTAHGPGTDGKDVTGRVAYLIGGRHREEALVRLADGSVQVFPIAFDADRSTTFEPLRELAGGTSPPPGVIEFWTRVGRNADVACYGCHATGQIVRSTGATSAGSPRTASKWIEAGVGCEACHGPGGPHVDARRAGAKDAASLSMTRAGARDMVDACAACHGLRDVLASPFRDDPAHRYGASIVAAADPLLSIGSNSEFRSPYFADLRPSTYQQEAIAFSQSGCARKGGMTCTRCHDVHSGELLPALRGDDGGSSICAPCHAAIVAAGSKHTLHAAGSPGGRCLDCHMAPIVRGPGHDMARDHSMGPPIAGKDEVPAACAVCHAGGKNADTVAARWKTMPQGTAAAGRRQIVEAIDASANGDAKALSLLARVAGDANRGWFTRWAALQLLQSAASSPESQKDLAPVRTALTDSNPAIRRAAARALASCGSPKDIPALQRASDDPDPWVALEATSAMGRLGSPTAGARLFQVTKRPDLIGDARAQFQYGHACLVGQDLQHADEALRRALLLNPMMVRAMNDLGLTLIGQKKRDEAIAQWNAALDVNPQYSAAKRNLEAAGTNVARKP